MCYFTLTLSLRFAVPKGATTNVKGVKKVLLNKNPGCYDTRDRNVKKEALWKSGKNRMSQSPR